MSTKILFLGATGYLGGSVLASLKKSYPEAKFTSLVRSSAHADLVRQTGSDVVLGSHADRDLVARLSADADIIVNSADSDDVGLLDALLEGQKKRKAVGNSTGVFIHVSGGAIFSDFSKAGKDDPAAKVWTDSESDIRLLTPEMVHGQVDVPLLRASEKGDVTSFIINPAGVYGASTGPVKRDSSFFKFVIGEYAKRKEVFQVGEGSNEFSLVHIDDVISLIDKVFELAVDALANPPKSSPYERYYNATTTPMTWNDLNRHFAQGLYKRGIIKSLDPVIIPYEEAGMFAFIFAGNTKFKSARAFELGWKPQYLSFSEEIFAHQIEVAQEALN